MNENQTALDMSQPTVRPTKKQKELLGFIESFIAEHGYSPSYREIMNGLQYTSVATVALHVGNLIKRGHLRKRDHSARSLEVVAPSGAAPEPKLPTNQVKVADEKWLVGQVERLLAEAETVPTPDAQQLEDIETLIRAMRILGLDGGVASLSPRLQAIRQKQPEA